MDNLVVCVICGLCVCVCVETGMVIKNFENSFDQKGILLTRLLTQGPEQLPLPPCPGISLQDQRIVFLSKLYFFQN